ncbi:MAG: IS110 family transposase [Bdellovibrio sp.]
MISQLESIPGIGLIGAVTIVAIVVDARRFEHRNHFLSYCGLVKHEAMSGSRSYGKRTPRHCRKLKSVFKTAATACIPDRETNSVLHKYYRDLIEVKKYPEHQARHALARRIAALALGVMKSGEKFNVDRINAEI